MAPIIFSSLALVSALFAQQTFAQSDSVTLGAAGCSGILSDGHCCPGSIIGLGSSNAICCAGDSNLNLINSQGSSDNIISSGINGNGQNGLNEISGASTCTAGTSTAFTSLPSTASSSGSSTNTASGSTTTTTQGSQVCVTTNNNGETSQECHGTGAQPSSSSSDGSNSGNGNTVSSGASSGGSSDSSASSSSSSSSSSPSSSSSASSSTPSHNAAAKSAPAGALAAGLMMLGVAIL